MYELKKYKIYTNFLSIKIFLN